jgi:PAS domain S-box-containing protein/putative nucleotidyltransferase with HDIG domain
MANKRPIRPVRRKTEEVRRKADPRRTVDIFEVLPDLIFRLDAEGVFLEFMGRPGKDLYRRPEEFLGRKVGEVLPADVAEFLVPQLKKVVESGMSASVEYLLPMQDGPQRYEARLIPSDPGQVLVLVRSVTQNRPVETILREVEGRYHALVELSPNPIAIHDGGTILYINRAAADLLVGGDRDRAVGRPVEQFVHPDSRPEVARRIRAMLRNRRPMPLIEEKFLRLDGSAVDVEVTAASFEEGERTLIQVIFRDISKRKADEAALARLARLNAFLSGASKAIARAADLHELLRVVCRVAVEQGGMKAAWAGLLAEEGGDLLPVAEWGDTEGYPETARITSGKGARGRGPTGTAIREGRAVVCGDIRTDPAMAPWRTEALRRGFRSSAALPVRRAGRAIGALNLYSPEPGAFGEGELEALESLASDLEFVLGALDQDRRRREAEMALAESEENFRGLFEHSTDAIYLTTPDGRLLSCNAAALRLFGIKPDEVETLRAEDLYDDPADRERFKARMARDGAVRNFEVRLRRRDGTRIDCLLSAVAKRGVHGEVTGYQGIIHDITERKRVEDALRASEQRYRDIVEHSADMFYTHGPDHVLTYVSPRCRAILGCEPEDALVRWTEFVTDHPVNAAGFEATQRAIDTGERQPPYELQLKTRDGRIVWVEVREAPVVRDGRTVSIVGAVTDITARKAAEEDLKIRDLAMATSLNGFAFMDPQMRVTYVNEAMLRMWGYSSPAEVLGRRGLDFWADADRARAMAKAIFETGRAQGQLDARRKDGTVFPVEFTGNLVRDASGAPLCVMGSFVDISRRKAAEAALEASERKYKDLVETTGTGFVIVDGEGRVLDANREYLRLTGRGSMEEILGRPVTDWTHPDDVERNAEEVRQCVASGSVRNLEIRYLSPAGRVTPVEINATVSPTAGGPRIITLVRDITSRKAAEAALRESEAQMRALSDNLAEGMVYQINSGRAGTERRFTYISPAVERLHGVTQGEAAADSSLIYRQVVQEDQGRLAEAEAEVLRTMTPLNIDIRVVPRSGEERWRRFIANPRTLPNGEVVWDGIELDITERKRAGAALRESEQKYRTLVESARDAIFVADAETGLIVEVNRQAEVLMGRPAAELLGMPQSLLHPPEHRERYRRIFAEHAHGENLLARDLLVRRADATDVPVDISATVVEVGGRRLVQGVFQDITDRKWAEKALQESLDMLQKSMQGTILAMMTMVEMRDPFTAGHQSRVARLSCAIGRAMGMTEQQVEGLRVAGLLHDIGKIGVPAEILSKPGRILDFEYNIIKAHPEIGWKILKEIEFPWPIATIVLHHHERLDGSGYPAGLKAKEILLESRILVVADVVEAMASHRPYRPARGLDLALGEVELNKGILYDPDVVDACVALFRDHGFAFD